LNSEPVFIVGKEVHSNRNVLMAFRKKSFQTCEKVC